MSDETPVSGEAAPDPLKNRFGDMERLLLEQPGSLARVLEELKAAGWAPDSGPLAATERDARCCLSVADALAAQAYTTDIAYAWAADDGEHLFRVPGRPPLTLRLEASFLRSEIGPERARLYVETLMRPLRDAAKAGRALAVRAGGMERRPLPPEPETGD